MKKNLPALGFDQPMERYKHIWGIHGIVPLGQNNHVRAGEVVLAGQVYHASIKMGIQLLNINARQV